MSGSRSGCSGEQSQTTCTSASLRESRWDVESEAVLRTQPRHGHDPRSSLRGEHAVHRVCRDGHQGGGAGGKECLGDEVDHLVGARADDDFVVLDAGVRGGGRRQLRVGGVGVLVDRRIKWTARARRAARRGRGRRVRVEAKDVLGPKAVARGDRLVRRLPRVDLRLRLSRTRAQGLADLNS